MKRLLIIAGLGLIVVGCDGLNNLEGSVQEDETPKANRYQDLQVASYKAYKAKQRGEVPKPTKQKPRPLYSKPDRLLHKPKLIDQELPVMIPAPKYIALTFDDGPHRLYTPAILDTLKEKRVKATFFVIGQMAAERPNLIKRMYWDGHQIGNHSYDHSLKRWANLEQISEQVNQTDLIIEEITGQKPTVYRPPYGYLKSDLGPTLKRPIIMWSLDSRDWLTEQPIAIVSRVKRLVQPGDVIILHDIKPQTVAALGPLIDQLKNDGYEFLTIEELFELAADSEAAAQGETYYYSQEPAYIPAITDFE